MDDKVIIQFVPELHEGGAEILVCEYCKRLKKAGFKVVLLEIFPPYESITYSKIKEMDIPVYHVFPKKNRFYRFMQQKFGRFYVQFLLKKFFKKVKPSTIHMHLSWLRYMQHLCGFFKKNDIQIVYTCHSVPTYYFTGRKEPEFHAAKRMLSAGRLQLIALTELMKKQLDDMFDISSTKVVHNAIDDSRYEETKTRNEIRHMLGIGDDEFVVGHVGRYVWQKNHKFIVRVFSELLKKQNAKLLLIGDGELKEEVKDLICSLGLIENVIMLSKRTDIPDLLQAIDVFIFPSQDEGLGIALIEAQFAGLRCVVSDELPQEVIITSDVQMLPISEGEKAWSDALLDSTYKGEPIGKKSDYIMDNEFEVLKEIYLRNSK